MAITPKVKDGNTVKFPFAGNFKDATFSTVAAKIRWVLVK